MSPGNASSSISPEVAAAQLKQGASWEGIGWDGGYEIISNSGNEAEGTLSGGGKKYEFSVRVGEFEKDSECVESFSYNHISLQEYEN